MSSDPIGHNGGFFASGVNHFILTFNKPIDSKTIGPDDFLIDGQMGQIHISGVTEIDSRTYRIDFPTLADNGQYHLTVLPTFLDTDGFALDENRNRTPAEPDDSYTLNFTIDTVAPRISQNTPAGDVSGTMSSIDVWFSEAASTPRLSRRQT